MFMYMFHIAFGIGLIALVMGLSMCCCKPCCKAACETGAAGTAPKSGSGCRKWCGVIISILALISLVCTVNTAYKQYNSGMMEMSMEEMHKMKDMMKDNMKDMKKDAGMSEPAAH